MADADDAADADAAFPSRNTRTPGPGVTHFIAYHRSISHFYVMYEWPLMIKMNLCFYDCSSITICGGIWSTNTLVLLPLLSNEFSVS